MIRWITKNTAVGEEESVDDNSLSNLPWFDVKPTHHNFFVKFVETRVADVVDFEDVQLQILLYKLVADLFPHYLPQR
jgi:hypothetical protein